MYGLSDWETQLLAGVGAAAVAGLAYLIWSARCGRRSFSVVDGLILIAVMSIVTGTTIPLFNGATGNAEATAVAENLYYLRSQIEFYKAEHGGEPPILRDGRLPQMTRATNAQGQTGPAGSKFPLGPYLHKGIPPNPKTGVSLVTPVDTFPPTQSSGTGGWLYHQASGQIAADVGQHLGR